MINFFLSQLLFGLTFFNCFVSYAQSQPRGWSKPDPSATGPSSEDLCSQLDHLEGPGAKARTDWFLSCGHGNSVAAELLKTPTPIEASQPPEPYTYPSLVWTGDSETIERPWIPNPASCAIPTGVQWKAICKGLETCDSQGVCPSERRRWYRDPLSDTGVANLKCDSGEDCVILNLKTRLHWMKHYAGQSRMTWPEWSKFCQDLTYGGYSDWRLPSKQEAQLAYFDGLWKVQREGLFAGESWWGTRTSTVSETDPAQNVWYVNVDTGAHYTHHQVYNRSDRSLCVRP